MVAELPDGVEASLLPHSPRLQRRFAHPSLETAYVAHLAERIRRNPRDLRAHVERVLLGVARRERPALLAALVDLQVALGAGGRALRAGLLGKAAGCLDDRTLAMLRGCLERGLAAGDPRAAVPGACLAVPVGGTASLVRRAGAAAGPEGAQQLAAEALASGDHGGAQCLLEAALEQDPGDAELGSALLSLYRRTGRRDDLRCMRTRLLGRRLAAAADWDRVEAELSAASPAGAAAGAS